MKTNERSSPAFLGALRGIWLFTWKPQLTWRRLPLSVLVLLVLPALVYLTTFSTRRWEGRHGSLGDPAGQVQSFASRLARAKLPLRPEQTSQLITIFQEEFARAHSGAAREPESAPGESSGSRQKAQIQATYERIETRARTVLDESQFARFQTLAKQEVLRRQSNVHESFWGRTGPFYHWLIDFYFFVILPLQCVKASGGLIRDELQADTLSFLVTRPLTRARLLVLKYLTQTAWLQIVLLAETLLLFAAGELRQIPSLGALLPLFLAAQFLAVLTWSALGVLLGLVAKRYMGVALVYGLIVELGIGRIPTNINTLSMMRHLKTLLSHNAALQGIYDWTATGVPLAIGALALATTFFLGLAALLFTFREYHQTSEH
jgi:ABC-2 type transport system permease protein